MQGRSPWVLLPSFLTCFNYIEEISAHRVPTRAGTRWRWFYTVTDSARSMVMWGRQHWVP